MHEASRQPNVRRPCTALWVCVLVSLLCTSALGHDVQTSWTVVSFSPNACELRVKMHGFGFAGVLREIGLDTSTGALLVSLFSFNLGVELGQLAVTAVLLPALWKLRERPAFARYGLPVISSVVVSAGAYWLIARLLF